MSAPTRWERVTPAAMAALLSLVATYAVLRAYDVLFKQEPNPATTVASMHIAMFWRVGVGAYVGGAVGMLVWFGTAKGGRRASRLVVLAIPIVAAMIAFQGLFLP